MDEVPPEPVEVLQLSSAMLQLVADLEAAKTEDNILSIDRMITAARAEYYNDKYIYPRGPSPTPIIDLMSHARKVGLLEIIQNTLNGKYD